MRRAPPALRATAFVARQRELAWIRTRFEAGAQVVVLVGSPGIGKTRLALRHADDHVGEVTFVDLAAARSLDELCDGVARSLGARPEADVTLEALGALIADREDPLVVLDNCEQILEAVVAATARWSELAPNARLLVTSRERLGVSGEQVLELRPLPRPAAAELFVDRVRSYVAGYDPAAVDAAAIDEIIRAVDGIPLAIELAASRVELLGVTELARRLPAELDLLATPTRDVTARHRTVRAAIEWSWSLLAPWERDALAQCSVFRGFTVAVAESVVDLSRHADAPSLIDVLASLRRKSLLYAVESAPRLGMYEVVREFVARHDGVADAERRHARYFAELAARVTSARDVRPIRELATELENLRAAYAHAVRSGEGLAALHLLFTLEPILAADSESTTLAALATEAIAAAERAATASPGLVARAYVLRAAHRAASATADLDRAVALATGNDDDALRLVALARMRHAYDIGQLSEASAELARTASELGPSADPRIEARLLRMRAELEIRARELAAARANLEAALGLAMTCGDDRECAAVTGDLAYVELALGNHDESRRYFSRTRELAVAMGAPHLAARADLGLGMLAQDRGDDDEAGTSFERARAGFSVATDPRWFAMSVLYSAMLAHRQGRKQVARAMAVDGLAISRRERLRDLEGWFLAAGAAVDADLGRLEEAERGFGEAETIARAIGLSVILEVVEVLRCYATLARAAEVGAAGSELVAAVRARVDAIDPRSANDDLRLAKRMLLARLGDEAVASPAASPEALVVARDLAWIRGPGSTRTSFRRMRSLRRILSALVEQRLAAPGVALTTAQLIERGWPGDRLVLGSGANRVHVAIATLRSAGLRGVLLSTGAGYALRADVAVIVSDER